MQTIQLNIGLSSKSKGDQSFGEVAQRLTAIGLKRQLTYLAHSQSEDGPESVLVVQCTTDHSVAQTISDLHALAIKLGQDCIAARISSPNFATLDVLVGPAPYERFDPQYFIEP